MLSQPLGNAQFGSLWHPAVAGIVKAGGVPNVDALRPLSAMTSAELRRGVKRSHLHRRTRPFPRKITDDFCRTCLLAFAAGVLHHDPTLHGHSERVASLSLRLGRRLRLKVSDMQVLQCAALLHDCGKLIVDPQILNKRGSLNSREFERIKAHPRLGADFLRCAPFLGAAVPAVRHHHEHYNGSGYPDGRRGEEIPLLARIIAISDAYDAMTAIRSYRAPLSRQAALNVLHQARGKQFDPFLVDEFLCLHRRETWDEAGVRCAAA